jgi:hypothetical protein
MVDEGDCPNPESIFAGGIESYRSLATPERVKMCRIQMTLNTELLF